MYIILHKRGIWGAEPPSKPAAGAEKFRGLRIPTLQNEGLKTLRIHPLNLENPFGGGICSETL